MRQIQDVLAGWGYRCRRGGRVLTAVICHVLLLNRGPLLEDLTAGLLVQLRADAAMGPHRTGDLYGLHRAVAALGRTVHPGV